MKKILDFYDWLTNISSIDFSNKSVLLIGGGNISIHYVLALRELGVKDITIITNKGRKSLKFCKEKKVDLLTGGFEKNLPKIKEKHLTIIALPIPDILPATKMAVATGQKNILIEKPGSLFYEELKQASKSLSNFNIKVAYNRLVYPNLHLLKNLCGKDGGITSCRFTFTERLTTIDFKKNSPEVYTRWGISNSLHVITMAFELIGFPKKFQAYHFGKIKWHPSGSVFIGAGISRHNIPFTYHADWGSGGRWGIEINTRKNSYQLIPMEELYISKKDSNIWNQVKFEKCYPQIKQGIAEEIAIMLDEKNNYKNNLMSLTKASQYNKLAEKIFGYK